jgi:hypothetical protein
MGTALRMALTARRTRLLPVQALGRFHRCLPQLHTATRERRLCGRRVQPVAADHRGSRFRHVHAIAPAALQEGPGELPLCLTIGGFPVHPVAERHLPVAAQHQPLIGQRSPADRAGEIGQHPSAVRLARADGHLPFPAPQFVAPRLPRPERQARRHAELPRADGRSDRRSQFAPKQRHHHPHRQQKPGPHGAPVPRGRKPPPVTKPCRGGCNTTVWLQV